MSFPRYAEYKDSGVEWLGKVPATWPVTPLKVLADFVNGCVFRPDTWTDSGTPIIRIENLNGGETYNYCDLEVDPRHHVAMGDLLFGWSGNRGTSFGPFVWRCPGRYFLNQHIFKLANIRCDKNWFYWALRAVTAHVEDQAHGIIGMVHVTKGDLGVIKLALPSEAEQTTIAAFLDRETGKIDALVAEQEKLIALLKEKRQAVISHAVTKGLNPDAPMKPSGIEWLGDVPAHWKVTQVKRLTRLITDGAHISPETDGGEYDFVSTKDVGDDFIDFEGALKTTAASYEYFVRTGCRPEAGDVLFSKDGTIGRTVVVRESRDFVVASSLIIIRPEPKMLYPEFLSYLCQSDVVRQQVDGFVKGAGLPRLSIQNLLKVVGVFPLIQEQQLIVKHLDSVSARFSLLVANAEDAIVLLKERRSALISAAVTGQIDLRGLVP